MFVATPCLAVQLHDSAQREQAIQWWEDLVAEGGEGIVVKPLQFVTKGKRGYVQPACRGPEYLRIIYGPDIGLSPH